MKRNCAVCGSSTKDPVYSQRLVTPSAAQFHSGQEVVICRECGFAYADNLPDQVALDKHYTNSHMNSEEPARYDLSLKNMLRFLQRRDRILDIGCGAGHLLNLIKAQGYECVVGLDPSEAACQAARRQYGLDVFQGSLFDALDLGRFDFIILSHVLEHIAELPGFISELHKLLNDEGRVYVEVPDAHNFILSVEPNAPLGWMYEKDLLAHFAPEHVNFFSLASLQNLMTRLGFQKLWAESQVSIMGVVVSVWRQIGIARDTAIDACLLEYVEAGRALLGSPIQVINRLVETQQEILVWGAGLHTQLLLGCTGFGKTNIRLFVDSNPQLQGQQLLGRPIVSPETLAQSPHLPILISSRRVQNEIKRQIEANGLKNPVILLYPLVA